MADETLDDKIAISNLHKELQRIENKDGLFTEAEKKRIAILQQTLNSEPALLKVLAHMEARQEKERSNLVQQHRAARLPDWGAAVNNLEERQRAERDRYIREYHDAQKLREQLRDNDRQREQEKGRTR